MLDSGAMGRNLVIVESPAKAKTIERYLGPGYAVLASYGHVRDLPENPGKGEVRRRRRPRLRPRVRDPRRAGAAPRRRHRARRPDRRPDLPRHRPRPRGRGDRLARRRGGRAPAGEARPGDLQRDHRGGDPRGLRPPPRDQPGPRRRPAGAPDRRPPRRLHAQPAHLAEGPRGAVGRPGPVGRGPPRRRARAGDPGLRRPRVLDDRGDARSPPTARRSRRTSSGSTGRSRRSATRRRAEAHARALRASRPVVADGATKKSQRSPAPPFTTSTLQQEASRKLGFSPKRTMSVAQRLYEGVETPDGQVGLITYMRTDSVAMAGQALGEAREVIARPLRRRLHDAQGARLPDEVAERPGGARGDPPDVVRPRPGVAGAGTSGATRRVSTG